MGRKKFNASFLSSLERLFRTIWISISLSFFLLSWRIGCRQKSLSFSVRRWGLLDEWCKRIKEKEEKEIWGLKRGKTPLEVYDRFFLFFGNFTLDSFGTIFTKFTLSFLSTPPKVIKNQHPYKWYLSHFINSQHLNNRPMLKKCW